MPSRSKRKDRRQSSFSFQRLLIVHQDLVETCTGRGLDEGASLEELSEHILYYYQNDQNGVRDDDSMLVGCRSCATAEAVQFAGLCSALQSLPSALSYSSENDVAKHVHLTSATLVFVPLEQSILAVAQFPRYGEGGHPGGGNPLAVQTSIQRCHHLFCLMRGGGIHYRLSMEALIAPESFPRSFDQLTLDSEKPSLKENEQRGPKSEMYPGMSSLYALRKRKRKQRQEISKLSPTLEEERGISEKKIEALDEEIEALIRSLPIQSVREDLCIHYDEYIAELKTVTGSGCVAGRCIVEHVPMPVPCEPHASFQRSATDVSTTVSLERSMQELLNQVHRDHSDEIPRLLGLSSFFNGQFIFTHVSPFVLVEKQGDKQATDNELQLSISPQTAALLNAYMLSFRAKVTHTQYASTASPASTPPRSKYKLGRLRTFVSDQFEEKAVSSMNSDELSRNEETMAVSGFLEPPPLSMLSTSDQIYEVHVPSFDHAPVWIPRVHLPVAGCPTTPGHRGGVIEAHVALFEVDCFNFLLYVKSGAIAKSNETAHESLVDNESPDDSVPEEYTDLNNVDVTTQKQQLLEAVSPSAIAQLLEEVSDHLSSGVQVIAKDEIDIQRRNCLPQPTVRDKWDEPGQDIVFVDRRQQRLTIITTRDAYRTQTTRNSPTKDRRASRISINFLGIRGPSGKERNGTKVSSKRSNMLNTPWPSTGLDCRHVLASHLPLDVILAFDDVMNEVHHLMHYDVRPDRVHSNEGEECGQREKFNQTSGFHKGANGMLEVCTFLPQGWVFAHAHGERELYILFDTDVYVTITDVQNAAVRVSHKLLGEPL